MKHNEADLLFAIIRIGKLPMPTDVEDGRAHWYRGHGRGSVSIQHCSRSSRQWWRFEIRGGNVNEVTLLLDDGLTEVVKLVRQHLGLASLRPRLSEGEKLLRSLRKKDLERALTEAEPYGRRGLEKELNRRKRT